MIDWKAIMEQKPEKSALEQEFDAVSKEYFETFGESFPIQYPPSDMQADIEAMRECIRTKKKRDTESVNNETGGIMT